MTEEHARRFARHIAISRGLHGEDLNDVEQIATIKWWRASDQHEGYQLQTINNAVSDFLRWRMRRGLHLAVSYEPELYEQADPYDLTAQIEYDDLVRRLLSLALPSERPVLELIAQGVSHHEGAKILGMPRPTFTAKVTRFRKRYNEFYRKNVS